MNHARLLEYFGLRTAKTAPSTIAASHEPPVRTRVTNQLHWMAVNTQHAKIVLKPMTNKNFSVKHMKDLVPTLSVWQSVRRAEVFWSNSRDASSVVGHFFFHLDEAIEDCFAISADHSNASEHRCVVCTDAYHFAV